MSLSRRARESGELDKDGFTATRPLGSLSTTGETSARAGFLRSAYRRGMWGHSRLIAAIHLGTVAHG